MKKNPLIAQGLPPSKAKYYTHDLIVEEKDRKTFQKRWDKYRSKLVLKRPGSTRKRCSAFLKKIRKSEDDGPVAKHLAMRFINRKVGYGVFALKPIKKGTIIGHYAGILRHITPREEKDYLSNHYLFGFGGYRELMNFSIDAKTTHNFACFMNHVGEDSPLCNVDAFFHFEQDFPRILFAALRDIGPEEQLCYNYGLGYWKDMGSSPKELY